MSDDFEFDEAEYSLNYDNIAKHKNLCNVTRVLAMDLMQNPYIVVGDFFKNLSDSSLEELLNLVNNEDEQSLAETLLLSEMLSRAEGVENNLKEMGENVGVIRILVAGTALHRKGLVKAYFENMTFGNENPDKKLFEKINYED